MSQVITGARGRVKINGQVVGFVGGVNVTVEDTLTDVSIMGQLHEGDLAETGHKCNFSMNVFRSVTDAGVISPEAAGATVVNSAAAMGIDSSFTTDQATGEVKPGEVNTMRSQAYFDVDLEDELTGKSFFALRSCKFEGGSGQMDARGVWQGTWNFRALKGYGL